MKTKLSRILTLALVLAMVLSMSIPAFAVYQKDEVFANTNYTLTVTGNELKGKNVTAIRMFTVSGTDVDGDGICYQDDITYTLDDTWKTFFTTAEADGGLGQTAPTDGDYSKAMHDYVFGLTNDSARADLAKKAKAWVTADAHAGDFSALKSVQTGTDANTATFANLKAGYYLVYPDSGSTAVGRATDAILVNVPMKKEAGATTDPVLQLKTNYPTVEKKVENNNATTAQVGDSVNFTLTSEVPNMEEYTEYYKFVFQDTMSEGLSYNTGSVKVYLGDSTDPLPEKSGDQTNYEVSWNGTTRVLTVTFNDLKKVEGATAGTSIKVTYTARLTEKAIKEGTGTNSALVEYSNDPKTDGTGKSNPSVTKVYTFPITIDKYTTQNGTVYGDGSSTDLTHLPGAVFELRTTETATGEAIKLVADATAANTYHIASFNELNDGNVTKVTQVTTPNDGKITINGLKAGTYYLHEVTPPEGYNKLANPVKIVIEADLTKEIVSPTYKIGDAEAQTSSTIPVLNEKGAVLPGTGSIGTIGLTILGVAVLVLAILMPDRKKKAI